MHSILYLSRCSTVNRETTYFHPRFLRGVPHLLGTIKRATKSSAAREVDEVKSITEYELARISDSRPLPSQMNPDDSSAIAAINASVAEEVLAASISFPNQNLRNISTFPIQHLSTLQSWNRGSNEATGTSSLSNDSGTNNQSSSAIQGPAQSQQIIWRPTDSTRAFLPSALSLQQSEPLNMQNVTAQPNLSTQNTNLQAALASLITQHISSQANHHTQVLQSIILACQQALENENAASAPHLQPAALPQPPALVSQPTQNQHLQNLLLAYQQTLNSQASSQPLPALVPQPSSSVPAQGQEDQNQSIQALITLLNLIVVLCQTQSTNDANA